MKHLLPLLVILGVLFAAPLLTPYEPTDTAPSQQFQPPSTEHPLGTDHLGRDVFSRVLYGGQRTLAIGLASASIAVTLGTLFALPVVFRSRRWDAVMDTVLDALLAFPPLILALVVMTLAGRGTLSIIVATGAAQVPYFARVIIMLVRSVLVEEYIVAAEAQGAGLWRIVHAHIRRNIQPTFTAYAAIVFSYTVINSAALSLLGLTADPSQPDWGVMLLDGRTGFRSAPWTVIAPGLALTVTVLAVQRLASANRS